MELLKKLEKYPGVKTLSTIPRTHSPVLPITFPKGAERSLIFLHHGGRHGAIHHRTRIADRCMFSVESDSE